MKIVVDDKIPFLKGVMEPYAEVIYLPGSKISKSDLTNADALLVRTRTKCNAALLEGTKVKFIATATIGYDHIDTDYCNANHIKWTNAPGCNSSSVEQYVLSVLLHISMKFNITLKDKKLGIIGVGNVGSKTARIAKILKMEVLLNDPPRARNEGEKQFVSLEKIRNEADFITLHVPLNIGGIDNTFHLIDNTFFGSLRKEVFLFNSSRGEVVDNNALKESLKLHEIKGSVLDVWENEPDIDKQLLDLLLFGTPHIAGYSADGKANGTAQSVNALSKFFGLNLHNWYPAEIPKPVNTEILIDCNKKRLEEVLFEAVKFSYDISLDDNRLRESIGTFEKQRGDYPLRREYGAYNVQLLNDTNNFADILRQIGFRVG